MKQALSALTNSGKYSATTFNLAFYLSNLLKKEFESEAVEREKETKVNVAPYVEAASVEVSNVGPALQPAQAESRVGPTSARRNKMPMAIAAALAVAVIGAGAFVAFGSKKPVAPAEPVKHLTSAVPTPPPLRQPVIPEPILASPAPQTGAPALQPTRLPRRKRSKTRSNKSFMRR